MSRVIIGIHGLGNKPSAPLLKRWWMKSILEGLTDTGAGSLYFKFEMAYWADVLHEKCLNPMESDEDSPYFIEDPYTPRTVKVLEPTAELRKRINMYIEKQLEHLILNKDYSINFSKIGDLIIHHFFKDLDKYYAIDATVRLNVRKRLSDLIERYKSHKILIIAHSMGSIIAFDVLSGLPANLSIDTLVTVGSPLGIAVIKGKIMAEKKLQNPAATHIFTPEAIKHRWVNYSDIEDKVALDYDLADDYLANTNGVFPENTIVVNDYVKQDKRNPHKVYGYLRTPQLAKVLSGFITEGRPGFAVWWLKKWGRIANRKYV